LKLPEIKDPFEDSDEEEPDEFDFKTNAMYSCHAIRNIPGMEDNFLVGANDTNIT